MGRKPADHDLIGVVVPEEADPHAAVLMRLPRSGWNCRNSLAPGIVASENHGQNRDVTIVFKKYKGCFSS